MWGCIPCVWIYAKCVGAYHMWGCMPCVWVRTVKNVKSPVAGIAGGYDLPNLGAVSPRESIYPEVSSNWIKGGLLAVG